MSRRTARFTVAMVAAWIVASLIATLAQGGDPRAAVSLELPPDFFTTQNRIGRGVVVGLVAGLLSTFLELRVMPRVARRHAVGVVLAVRTLAYAAVGIIAMLAVVRIVAARSPDISVLTLVTSDAFRGFIRSPAFGRILVSMIVSSFVINGIIQINRILGPGVGLQILMGRYLRPREEERAFLFIDLVGSTRISEALGPLDFSEFRNAFFHDLAAPVVATGGQIVQYVGDEAVITWRDDMATDDANCLRCFFLLEDRIDANADDYMARFGEVPRFKAGAHVGPVVVSEVGDIKREISFSGDTINTTARLESLCRDEGRSFLASWDLIAAMGDLKGMVIEDLGERSLRGKRKPVRVVAVERAAESTQGVVSPKSKKRDAEAPRSAG